MFISNMIHFLNEEENIVKGMHKEGREHLWLAENQMGQQIGAGFS